MRSYYYYFLFAIYFVKMQLHIIFLGTIRNNVLKTKTHKKKKIWH